MPSRSILLADDLRDTSELGRLRSAALRKLTKSLAQHLGLRVQLLYVDNLGKKINGLGKINSKQIQSWQNKIHNTFRGVKSSLPEDAEFLLRVGSPAHEIIALMNRLPKPEMTILGSQGRKGLKRLFMGSVAEEVLRHALRPVLVLGPMALKTRFPQGKSKQLHFLVLTDLSKASRPAEHYAQSLAKRMNARLTLCHSVGDQIHNLNLSFYSYLSPNIPVPTNLDEVFAEMIDEANESLQKKKDTLFERGLSVETKLLMQQAPLAKTLPRELSRNYDLVIMGTHSHHPAALATLGTCTRTAILKSPTPVFVVRSI